MKIKDGGVKYIPRLPILPLNLPIVMVFDGCKMRLTQKIEDKTCNIAELSLAIAGSPLAIAG